MSRVQDTPLVVHPSQPVDVGAASRTSREVVIFMDDFLQGYDTTFKWAVQEDSSASTGDVISDAQSGVLNLGCDGDNDDECYVSSIAECWKFDTSRHLVFEARVKHTVANTGGGSLIVGLSDTVAANSLLDSEAGPMASFDGACFYRNGAVNFWGFITSNAATQKTTAHVAAFTSAAWTTLRFQYDPNDGVTAHVTPVIDGVTYTAHDLTISGLEEMHILLGVKTPGTSEEALLVDYVRIVSDR